MNLLSITESLGSQLGFPGFKVIKFPYSAKILNNSKCFCKGAVTEVLPKYLTILSDFLTPWYMASPKHLTLYQFSSQESLENLSSFHGFKYRGFVKFPDGTKIL